MNLNLKAQLTLAPKPKVLAAWQGWFRQAGGQGHISGIYNSDDPAVIKDQVQTAKAIGVDGFVADWYGSPDTSTPTNAATLALMKECERSGFEFSIMPEGRLKPFASQLQYIRDNFLKSPAYSKLNGKPLIWEFGFKENHIDISQIALANPDLLFLCQTNPSPPGAPDTYAWVNMWPGYPAQFISTCTIPCAYAHFDDSLASWGSGRKIPSNNGQTWQTCINLINSRKIATPYVLICTWNDYEEGTAIEKEVKAQLAPPAPTPVPPAPTPAPATSISYIANITSAMASLLASQLPSGALPKTSSLIEPYAANLAALGLVQGGSLAKAQAVAQWYITHMNLSAPDVWGLFGTVYDYSLAANVEKSNNSADSTDSYAATFVSLMSSLYHYGDSNTRDFVRSSRKYIDIALSVILRTMQPYNLTFAKPDYDIAFLMDNCEVYKALNDAIGLYYAFEDQSAAEFCFLAAAKVKTALLGLWDSNSSSFLTVKDQPQADLKKWYPDTVAQFFPLLYGVIDATSPQTSLIVKQFKATWPNWASTITGDSAGFPWCEVAAGMALAGEYTLVDQWLAAVKAKYNLQFPYPWYCAQLGWFIRLNRLMMFRDQLR